MRGSLHGVSHAKVIEPIQSSGLLGVLGTSTGIVEADGISLGSSSVTSQSSTLWYVLLTTAGVGTALGVGDFAGGANGHITSTSSVSGIGAIVSASVAQSAGSMGSTPLAISGPTSGVVYSSSGSGIGLFTSTSVVVLDSVASSNGTSTVSGLTVDVTPTDGISVGSSTSEAQSSAINLTIGNSSGSSASTANSQLVLGYTFTSNGVTTVTGLSAYAIAGVGEVLGIANANFISSPIVGSVAESFGENVNIARGERVVVFREPAYVIISSHIESQFPEFIRNEGPRFVEFLKAYYEHAEQINEAVYAARKLTSNQDIDSTTSVLLEYFRREFLANIPTNALADKRLVTKHIRDFYRARGSADAYRFLFRILFNAEIDIYYPGEDILRCSDGRWVVETILSVGGPKTGNPETWEGDVVVGSISSARGRVESVTKSFYSGVETWELVLSNVNGSFSLEESINNIDKDEYATINTSSGPLSDATITTSGAFHQNDDDLTFTELLNTGHGATGTVLSTTDTSALTFKIIRGGKGYRLTSRIVVGPSTGSDAAFTISGLANTESISLNSDLINSVKNVVLNTGPLFISLGANSTAVSANLATANVSSVIGSKLAFVATTVGRISMITLTNPGYGYNRNIANGIPTCTIIDDQIADLELSDGYGGIKGRDAVIIANNAPGAMVSTTILTRGVEYNKNEIITIRNNTLGIGVVDTVTTDNQQTGLSVTLRRQNSFDAIGGSVPGGTTLREGRYIDTRGFLSWNNKLQDNEYYQAFSYVIRGPVLFDSFITPVKNLLNPAGTKVFGTYTMDYDVTIDVDPTLNTSIEYTMTVDYPTVVGYLDVESVVSYATGGAEAVDITLSANVESTYRTWNTMSGTVSISDMSIISPFSSTLISVYSPIKISAFVDNLVLIGSGTNFSALAPIPGAGIVIVATSTPLANGMYTITATANNTFATFEPRFVDDTLVSGYILY